MGSVPQVLARGPGSNSRIDEATPLRLAILCHESRGRVDAIRTYSTLLAETLTQAGAPAGVLLRTEGGRWVNAATQDASRSSAPRDLDEALLSCDAVILQYNPFLYGRWGFAPWLPLSLRRLGRQTGRPPTIALMVHEPYVPMVSWRWALMGLWQRAQLTALRAEADVVFVSIEAWASALGRQLPRRRTTHLPVPSNLPDRRAARAEGRERLGVDEKTLVLTAFGTGHPARLMPFVVQAANAAAGARGRLVLLNLGAGALALHGLDPAIELREPGAESEEALARQLAASDIFLIPLVDGVSTRRCSLMAAMQHGLAVVATGGPATDRVLRDAQSALRLVPAERPDLFSAAAVDLAERADERRRLGEQARNLYAEQFDWPVLAARILRELGIESPRVSAQSA